MNHAEDVYLETYLKIVHATVPIVFAEMKSVGMSGAGSLDQIKDAVEEWLDRVELVAEAVATRHVRGREKRRIAHVGKGTTLESRMRRDADDRR